MKINLKSEFNEIYSLEIQLENNIKDIKEILSKKINQNPEDITFFYENTLLNDNISISSLNIKYNEYINFKRSELLPDLPFKLEFFENLGYNKDKSINALKYTNFNESLASSMLFRGKLPFENEKKKEIKKNYLNYKKNISYNLR